MAEVAAILQEVKGVPVEAIFVNAADALASGVHPALINSYEWDNVEAYHVDISALKAFGIQLTTFKTWAAIGSSSTRHRTCRARNPRALFQVTVGSSNIVVE